jgi:Prokaryotic homologs of the JAB domain
MDAPSGDELKAHPVVQAAFAAAWADSFPDDQALRHEEGGYIYINPTTGEVVIRRALPGSRNTLDMTHPPAVPNAFLVATYHTHPTPPSGRITAEPSDDDRELAFGSGIPWFVISHEGVFVTGPDQRDGGFSGPAGYPY